MSHKKILKKKKIKVLMGWALIWRLNQGRTHYWAPSDGWQNVFPGGSWQLASPKPTKERVFVFWSFWLQGRSYLKELTWLSQSHLVTQMVESACNLGDLVPIPVSGISSGEGNSTSLQYFCLENSMDWGAWQITVHGVTKSQTPLNDHFFF